MTTEQFERAKELERRINRLKGLLASFKSHEIDDSPCRMTGFTITEITGGCQVDIINIENSELEFLISAIESRIAVLEHEFKKL
jgi:hypothetical protein